MASPTVVARSTFVSSTTNSTSWTPLSSVTVVPGELLLFVCSADGVPTLSVNTGSSTAGWTKLDQASDATSAVTGAIFVLLPDDNKAATATLAISSTASEQYSGILYRIRGADSLDFGAAATGSSTNSNPPSNTLPVSARDILAIATRSGDSTVVATVAPASYTNLQSQAGGGTSGVSTNSAERALSATATEDPGTFTSATEQWVSYTVLLYQGDAVTNGQTIANNANTTVTYRGGSVYEVEKTAGVNGYNASAVSSVGITGDFVLRLRPLVFLNGMFVGVNSDPLTDNGDASIDFAWAANSATSGVIFESGSTPLGGSTTLSGYFWIWRSGTTLGYGTGADLATAQASPVRTVTTSATLYFDSTIFTVGERFESLFYEPSSTAYSLTAANGGFSYTGQAAALAYGRDMAAAVGTFSYSGQAAALVRAAALPANTGTYAYTGQAAALYEAAILTASSGAFSYGGQGAGLIAAYAMMASAGVVGFSGQTAGLPLALKVATDAGMFAYSGEDASLVAAGSGLAVVLAANAGVFAYLGPPATLTYLRLLFRKTAAPPPRSDAIGSPPPSASPSGDATPAVAALERGASAPTAVFSKAPPPSQAALG